jgi:hypothetical protein
VTSPEKVAQQVRDVRDDMKENLQTAVPDAMEDTTEQAQTNVERNDSVATGALHDELDPVELEPGPHRSSNTVTSVRLRVPWPYMYVEMGTGLRGGASPYPDNEQYPSPSGVSDQMLANIQQWIEDKGVVGKFYSAAREPDGSPSPLANAIAESIVDFGTKPHPFLRPAWYGSRHGRLHVFKRMDRAMSRAVRRN